MTSKLIPVLTSLFTAWVLMAGDPNTAGAAEAGTQQITVHLGEYYFKPDTIEVIAGRPVELTLKNDDRITPHTFTLKEPDANLSLDASVSGGESGILHFTPQKAGVYTFYCRKKLPFMKSHREHGMEGKLVVKPAD